MKIEHLHFRSLASFAGEWSIDFTDPDLARTGVFLVTGDTGAGKTTVFDAVCLALFGQTPRLGDIRGLDNELMSKGQGSCLAEVVFSDDHGRRWLASWSQRRARGKAAGRLQPYVHQYADITGGRSGRPQDIPKGSQARDEAVRKITGMTFAQFSRSVLLAQGEFAAFLKASAAERAPVLEQITGTGIYRAISAKIYQICGERQAAMDALAAEIAGIPVLSSEDRARKEAELRDLADQAQALGREAEAASAELGRLRAVHALERKQAEAREGLARIAEERAAFAPEEAKLACSARALGARDAWTALGRARGEASRALAEADAAMAALPKLEQASAEKAAALEALEAQEARMQAEAGELQPQAQEAARLEAEEEAKAREAEEARRLSADHAGRLASLEKEIAEARAKLAGVEAERTRLGEEQAGRPRDGGLAQALAGFEQRLAQAGEAGREAERKKKAWAEAGAALAGAREAEAGSRQVLARAVEAQAEAEQALARAGEALAVLERPAGEDELGKRAAFVQEAQASAMGLASAWEAFCLEREGLCQARARLEADLAEAARLEAAAAAAVQPLKLAEELLASCQRAWEQARLAQSGNLLALRARLAPDGPCPLCGSLDHPYCQGRPLPEEDREGLEQARKEAERIRKDQTRTEGELARTRRQAEAGRAECGRLGARLARSRERLGAARDGLAQKLSACPAGLVLPAALAGLPGAEGGDLQAEGGALGAWLGPAGEALEALRQDVSRTLEGIRGARLEEGRARKALDRASQARQASFEAHAARERARAAAEAAAAAAEEALGDAEARAAEASRTLREDMAAWLAPEAGGGAEEADRDWTLEEGFRRLAGRAQAFARRAERLDLLAGQAGRLSASLEAMEQALARQASLARQAEEALGRRLAEAEALGQARQARFPAGDPRQALARLEAERRRLLARASGLRGEASAAAAALAGGLAARDRLVREQAEREGEALRLEKAFAASLAELGFAGEAQWQACLLPEAEARRIEAEARRLGEARARFEAVLADSGRDLQALGPEPAGARSEEELAGFLEEAGARRSLLDQDRGRLAQELESDDASREQTRQTRAKMDAMEPELAQWQELNRLAGQSDGQKFARYAQGITLRALAAQANRQLERLDSRYRLLASAEEDLEFEVLDRYRGGLVRSTRNLSGGESFLVSLALALGLAEFSRGEVRVQTLFLDEGFGTLDRQAMDTAVQALLALPPDSGSLVGIISHVEELKERIKTNIRVAPHPGGSTLSGPGCARGPRLAGFDFSRREG